MSKEKEKKINVLKSNFFLKLYGIPAICWVMISLIAMIPDETDPDPLTWGDLIIADLFLLICWFAISIVITLIVNEVKKKTPKTITKEVQPMIKSEEKVVIKINKEENNTKQEKKNKNNSKCLYICESILDGYEYKKWQTTFLKEYIGYL